MKLLGKLVLFLSLCICIANSADPLANFCNKDTAISNASKASKNIDALLAKLVLQAPRAVTTSFGIGKDQVYGLAQCREDVSTQDCSNCISDAAKQIRARCPNEFEARISYDYCFLRYNNNSDFIGRVDTSHGIYYINVESVSDPASFNKELGALMGRIRKEATNPRNKGLGKGETKLSPFLTLYGLGQCTRDLPPIECAQCLAIAIGNFPTICENRKGCRAVYISCYVRYELYPFYFPLKSKNAADEDRSHVTMVHT